MENGETEARIYAKRACSTSWKPSRDTYLHGGLGRQSSKIPPFRSVFCRCQGTKPNRFDQHITKQGSGIGA